MDYGELRERLRDKANLTEHDHVAREYREAANAIQELEIELDRMKKTVACLKNSQHYSGRFIKSIMGEEDG